MRIGIDGTSWLNGRGYGRYTREILSRLFQVGAAHTFLVFLEEHNVERLGTLPANVTVVPVACAVSQTESASADGYRSPRDLLRMSAAVRRVRPDVMYFPTVYTYFPLPPGVQGVVTIHDAIVERFPELTMPSWRARMFWKLKVNLALRQCPVILTVSEFAADDVSQHLSVSRERLRVSGEAPSAVYRRGSSSARRKAVLAPYGLTQRDRWFTYVGGFNPHKRLDVLIEAHGRLAAESENPPHLLLVGSLSGDVFHGCREELTRSIERLGTGHLVHWTGFVSDEDLAVLHEGALANVLASMCEGFGLPAVEAAASGTAVIATTESPLPQLLAGGGLFVRPADVDALHAALRTMATEPETRRAMAEIAHERAHAMDWGAAAANVLAAIVEAAA